MRHATVAPDNTAVAASCACGLDAALEKNEDIFNLAQSSCKMMSLVKYQVKGSGVSGFLSSQSYTSFRRALSKSLAMGLSSTFKSGFYCTFAGQRRKKKVATGEWPIRISNSS